jgi:guanylate kinase
VEDSTSQGMQGSLVVVSAPSGGGKTSLTRALLPWLAARGVSAELSVSYTTREPRAGEIPGEHYHFVSPQDFTRRVDEGGFLEHAEVFGRHYGTARDATEARCAAGIDVILDIDWQGLRQVRLHSKDVASVFILPPSVEVLAERLRGRGQDSEQVIADRMAAARAEMRHYDEYEHVIINDDFNVALEALGAIFLARRQRQRQQTGQHAELIKRLLA